MKKRLLAGLGLLAAVVALGAACGGEDSGGDGGAVNPPAAAAQAAGVVAQQDSGQGQSGITVAGQGIASLEPDVALVGMGVSVVGNTAGAAREQASSAMDHVLGSVRDNAVSDSDIRTTQFSLHPEYNYSGSVPRLTGYRVTNMVSVKVRDLGRVAEVIDDAVAAAGDDVQISGVSFTADNPDARIGEARAQAMASARAKAEELASAGGVTLGAPLSIVESSNGGMPPWPIYRDMAMSASVDESTPIQPGELEVSVTVQVTYSIS